MLGFGLEGTQGAINVDAIQFQFLHDTPPNRVDLLPFYGRLVATLRPVAPEIASGLLAAVSRLIEEKKTNQTRLTRCFIQLEDDFRYLYKRKNVELRDRRTKVHLLRH